MKATDCILLRGLAMIGNNIQILHCKLLSLREKFTYIIKTNCFKPIQNIVNFILFGSEDLHSDGVLYTYFISLFIDYTYIRNVLNGIKQYIPSLAQPVGAKHTTWPHVQSCMVLVFDSFTLTHPSLLSQYDKHTHTHTMERSYSNTPIWFRLGSYHGCVIWSASFLIVNLQ